MLNNKHSKKSKCERWANPFENDVNNQELYHSHSCHDKIFTKVPEEKPETDESSLPKTKAAGFVSAGHIMPSEPAAPKPHAAGMYTTVCHSVKFLFCLYSTLLFLCEVLEPAP